LVRLRGLAVYGSFMLVVCGSFGLVVYGSFGLVVCGGFGLVVCGSFGSAVCGSFGFAFYGGFGLAVRILNADVVLKRAAVSAILWILLVEVKIRNLRIVAWIDRGFRRGNA
jgi:hypothetical protein